MRKIRISGAGAVTPLGADLLSSWQALLAGEMSLQLEGDPLPEDLQAYPIGRAKLQEAIDREGLRPKELRRLDPVAQLSLCAAREALRDADWPSEEAGSAPSPDPRFGVVMGVGYGATTTHLQTMDKLQAGRAGRLSPFTIPASMPNASASQLAMAFGAQGPALTVGTACASGSDAVGVAFQLLQAGMADRILCGGAEWIGDAMGVGGMAAAKALAKAVDGDTAVLKPFDLSRKGTAVGTGAAMFLLEAVEASDLAGGDVLLLGYGCSSDAHHITAPLPDGAGAEQSMRAALSSAGVGPEAVGGIYAHGTGTPLNDAMEAEAVARLFPQLPPMTSTKGQYGHAMGASGALNLAFAVRTVCDGVLPPTRPCPNPDPELAVRPLLEGDPTPDVRSAVLVNAFGFGGHNASLLLGPAARFGMESSATEA